VDGKVSDLDTKAHVQVNILTF